MEYNIYLDVFFLLNFILNVFLLAVGNRLFRLRYSWKKILFVGAAGALMNSGLLIAGIRMPGMIFFLAWCMSLLEPSTWMVILLVLFIAWQVSRIEKKQEKEIRVILHFKGREKEFQGFYDSGNLLREPVTGKMVHIACYDEMKDLLPETYQQVAETYYKTGIFESTKVTKLQMYEFTFLSYHSIGKETGQLLGIRMDSAVFKKKSGEIRSEKAVIALANQKLFVRGGGRIIINGRLEL